MRSCLYNKVFSNIFLSNITHSQYNFQFFLLIITLLFIQTQNQLFQTSKLRILCRMTGLPPSRTPLPHVWRVVFAPEICPHQGQAPRPSRHHPLMIVGREKKYKFTIKSQDPKKKNPNRNTNLHFITKTILNYHLKPKKNPN